MLECEGLAAVCSEHAELECRPDPDMLWRHEQVVECAMGSGAVLPARFGTTFSDLESLRVAVTAAGPWLCSQLDRVRGCVELAVRVGVAQLPEASERTRHSGREYLEAQLAGHRRREALAERTLVPLSRLAVGTRRRDAGGKQAGVIAASYLVREPEVAKFVDRVRLLQSEQAELSVSCTGPWAPYSFSGQDRG
jgi:hypothetical protein